MGNYTYRHESERFLMEHLRQEKKLKTFQD